MYVQESHSAELVHDEYLHKERTDPRRAFAERLIELCGNEGTILVYNQAFEIARNNELARDFPDLAADIQSINARVLDLLVPFKKRWLYHPNQNSSASIKAVLPTFTDLDCKDMEISHGGEAMIQYGNFMQGQMREDDLPDLWHNFTEYCKQDTYAMAMLLDVLREYSDG